MFKRRKWKTVWKQLTTVSTQTFWVNTGTMTGVIKLQEKVSRRGKFKYRVIICADGYLSQDMDMDQFELMFPEVYNEYVIED